MSSRAGSERRGDRGTVMFYALVEISDVALEACPRADFDTMIAIEVEEAAQGLYAEIEKWAR